MAPILGIAQNSALEDLLATSNSSNNHRIQADVDAFLSKISEKSFQTKEQQLKWVFRKTGQRFLKFYSPYPSFEEIFTDGKYNCLTATSLYSIILSAVDLQFKIIETNYHIFILIEEESGGILLETTDPLDGLVFEKEEIQERINKYKTDGSRYSTDQESEAYNYQVALYNEVGLEQLPGLLYFNKAVNAYNDKDLTEAINLLCKATLTYHSPRIAEFGTVLLQTAMSSNLSEDAKLNLYMHIKKYWDTDIIALL